MILALSDEDAGTVDEFLDREGFTVRTASGSRSKGDYGVRGIPATFLVGADGTLLWKGHPNEITAEKLKALIGAPTPAAAGDFLSLRAAPGAGMHASLEPAVEAAEAGNLALALQVSQAVSVDAAEGAAARAAAKGLVGDIEAHAALLEAQAEDYQARREPLPAREILEGLAAAFSGTEPGQRAQSRLEALSGDEAWTAELAGALALEVAIEASIGKDRTTARKALRVVQDEHAGTLAARRAKRRMKRK